MASGKTDQRAPVRRGIALGALPHIRLAIAAFFVVGLGALGAIQIFGDPAAAGPRQVLSLGGPSDAEAAPRVSFSQALDDQSVIIGLEEFAAGESVGFGREPANAGAPGAVQEAPAGQLRISVVEAVPARATASPLSRAPAAGLTERGPLGLLPIAARDGRTAASVYARPFPAADTRPKIAIIVGGLGFNARNTTQAIDELPAEVTLSFVPYASNLQSWVDRARARGHEVMLELPMEPFDPETDDTGPQTLLAAASAEQNVRRLENLLSRATGYFGVTNYQGARFATSASASGPVVQQVRRRGLVFLTSGIGQRSALSAEAARAGLAISAADRIIDARREAEAIDEQLLNLEALALQNQTAIGAGFAFPVTMEQIATWARDVNVRGYALAPVSATLAQRNAPRR